MANIIKTRTVVIIICTYMVVFQKVVMLHCLNLIMKDSRQAISKEGLLMISSMVHSPIIKTLKCLLNSILKTIT